MSVTTIAIIGALGAVIVLLSPPTKSRGIAITLSLLILFTANNPTVPFGTRDVTLLIVGVYMVLANVRRTTWQTRPMGLLVGIIGFYIFQAVGTLAYNPGQIGGLTRLALIAILVTYVASMCSPDDVRVVYNGILVLASVQIVFGVYEYVTGTPIFWGYGQYANSSAELKLGNPLIGGGDLIRIQGTAGHAIPYGVVMAAAIAVVIVRWHQLHRFWRLVLFAVFGAGLLYSGTRSAILGLILAIGYGLVVSRASRSRLRNFGYAAIGAFAIFVFDFGIRNAVQQLLDSGSYTNRAEGIGAGPALLGRPLGEALFGSGFASEASLFDRGFLQQSTNLRIVDNQLITTLATAGAIGLIILLALLVIRFVRTDPVARTVLILLLTMMFSFDFLRWHSMVFLFFAILALPRLELPGALNFESRAELEVDSSKPLRGRRGSRTTPRGPAGGPQLRVPGSEAPRFVPSGRSGSPRRPPAPRRPL